MSIGCERVLAKFESPRDDDLTCYIRSYTDLTFRDPARHATEEQLTELAFQFLQNLSFKPAGAISFELGIQRMKHFFGDNKGYNMSLGISGYGRDEREASDVYEETAAAAAASFRRLHEGPQVTA